MPRSKIISDFMWLSSSTSVTDMRPANATTVSYIYKPLTTDSVVHIQRAIGFIEDNANFVAEGYGAIAGALANGISMGVYDSDDNLLYQLTDPDFPVKSNTHWGAYCHDVNYQAFGAGNNMLTWRWTFGKSGTPIYLHQERGDYIGVTIADTLTALVAHRILIQGHYIATGG